MGGNRHIEGDYKELSAKYVQTGKISLSSTIYKSVNLKLCDFQPQSSTGAALTMQLQSTGTNSTAGVGGWAFDAGVCEWLMFGFTMPTDYKEGTSITPYIHWGTTGSTGTAQQVAWTLVYSWTNQDGVLTATQSNVYPTGGTANYVYTTNFSALTSTSMEVGSHIIGTIARNSTATTDSFSADAYFYGLDFYYQVDTMGSTAGISDK